MAESANIIAQDLARQREAKGLTVAQLSAKTKIAERFIEAMENGKFDFLPVVYVRAFVRTLSLELGLDPNVMGRQLLAHLGQAADEKPMPETNGEKRKDRALHLSTTDVHEVEAGLADKRDALHRDNGARDQRFLIVGVMMVAAILLLVVSFFMLRPSTENTLLDTGTVVEKREPGVPADTTTLIPLHETATPALDPTEELNLTIKVTDSAWVRIVYQDSLADEGVFAPGDGRNWISYNRFYLKIGNAGGVRLYLNNQDMGNAGSRGKVANLLIDKQGVAKITDADFPPAMKWSNTP